MIADCGLHILKILFKIFYLINKAKKKLSVNKSNEITHSLSSTFSKEKLLRDQGMIKSRSYPNAKKQYQENY